MIKALHALAKETARVYDKKKQKAACFKQFQPQRIPNWTITPGQTRIFARRCHLFNQVLIG